MKRWAMLVVLAACVATAAQAQDKGETLVLIRHGEKPLSNLGQMNCRGLNRSLALPAMLVGRYGRPDYLYAPNPSVQIKSKDGTAYSYVRPLATIEPTAIQLEMPVNAQIGYNQLDALQQELVQPAYAGKLIFVAWEHVKLRDFALQMLKAYGDSTMTVPEWPNSDYETIYVFHITRAGKDGAPRATLEIQKEGLETTLKDTCPGQEWGAQRLQ